jgi:hypothetical protein
MKANYLDLPAVIVVAAVVDKIYALNPPLDMRIKIPNFLMSSSQGSF